MMIGKQRDGHVRAARNQALFRDVNERLEDIAAAFAEIATTGSFTCGCADLPCIDPIEMTIGQYEAVRREPTHFAVAPGHVFADVEDVVREHPGFVVVAKRQVAATIAAAEDPRTADS